MLISGSVDKLNIFADPLRTEIIVRLVDEQLCTCHLVDLTGARQPTISYHLKLLRDAGLVETEAVGRNTYYRIIPERLEEYSTILLGLANRARSATKERYPCS